MHRLAHVLAETRVLRFYRLASAAGGVAVGRFDEHGVRRTGGFDRAHEARTVRAEIAGEDKRVRTLGDVNRRSAGNVLHGTERDGKRTDLRRHVERRGLETRDKRLHFRFKALAAGGERRRHVRVQFRARASERAAVVRGYLPRPFAVRMPVDLPRAPALRLRRPHPVAPHGLVVDELRGPHEREEVARRFRRPECALESRLGNLRHASRVILVRMREEDAVDRRGIEAEARLCLRVRGRVVVPVGGAAVHEHAEASALHERAAAADLSRAAVERDGDLAKRGEPSAKQERE